MRWMIILLFLALSACQTPQRNSNSERTPDAVGGSGWQEILVDEPASFLEATWTQKQVLKRQHKLSLLRDCGVTSLGSEALETDLLFIRLENWPSERLQKEYLPKMSPQNLRCLQDGMNHVGV